MTLAGNNVLVACSHCLSVSDLTCVCVLSLCMYGNRLARIKMAIREPALDARRYNRHTSLAEAIEGAVAIK